MGAGAIVGEAGRGDMQVAPAADAEPMMGQAEIVAFLEARGVAPLAEWRPGEAILYVVEDGYRTDTAHYGDLPGRLRPSVARLDAPDSVVAGERAVDRDGTWTQMVRIVNETGGQVDYYAIDPRTHEVAFVRSSASIRDKDYPYVAPGRLLFRGEDGLFPKA